MNNEKTDKVVQAIDALAEKAKESDVENANGGVDLLAIVKKLSRNREKGKSK